MTALFDSNSVLLEAQDLYCERDDRVLFSDFNIAIKNGDLVQLSGPNGAGKTTLLRLLAGLNRDYQGKLLWQGNNLYKDFYTYVSQRLYQGHLAAVKKPLTPLDRKSVVVGKECRSRWSPDD